MRAVTSGTVSRHAAIVVRNGATRSGMLAAMGLEDDPFDWRVTKNGQVHVSRGGRTVTIMRGAAASQLLAKLERADDEAAQHLLARATGNYKRGNERQ